MALRPPSLATLLKMVTRLFDFPPDEPAQTLYDEDDEPVRSMDDVPPGATLYVSQIPDPRVSRAPIESDRQHGEITQTDKAQASTTGTSQTGSRFGANSRFGAGSRFSRGPSGGFGNDRSPDANASMLLIVDDKASATSYRSQKRHRAEAVEDLEQTETELDEIRYGQTGISHRELERILKFLAPGIVPAEIANILPPIVARLGSSVPKCAGEQQTVVYQNVLQLFGEIAPPSEALKTLAGLIVDSATFGNDFNVFVRMKQAVIGPSKSGKSNFLKVLNATVLARFLVTGQYQKTLMFYLDFESIAESLADTFEFYGAIVRTTFAHLTAQLPPFAQFQEMLQTYFEKLPTRDRFVALPTRFSTEPDFRETIPILNTLARGIFDCVQKSGLLIAWLTHIAIFPRSVALAFGFGNVHFAIDHLDLVDFELHPQAPFDSDRKAVTLLEFVKFMLANDSFIVAGKDETHFFESLDSLGDDGIDLREGLECISMVDIDDDHSDRYAFKLQLADEPQKLSLRLIDCGGCPGYLSIWDEMMTQAERVKQEERKDSSSRIAAELRLLLLTKIRELVALIFCRIDDDREVVPVGRQVITFKIQDTDKVTGMKDGNQ